MFCEKCGATLVDGAKFCKSCGSPVAKEESVNSNYDENRIGEERTITRVFSNADDIVFLSPLKKGQEVMYYVVEKKACIFGDKQENAESSDGHEKWWHASSDLRRDQ